MVMKWWFSFLLQVSLFHNYSCPAVRRLRHAGVAPSVARVPKVPEKKGSHSLRPTPQLKTLDLPLRGAACSNLDTKKCAKTLGFGGGGGGGGSAGQPPRSRGGGGGGGPWVPQHTYLKMIPMTR